MKKIIFSFNLPVVVLKEGKRYVAYSPALDLSSSGKTFERAKENFTEAAKLFFEEVWRKGTVDQSLGELGWQKVKKEWKPPVVVSQQAETIRVPVSA